MNGAFSILEFVKAAGVTTSIFLPVVLGLVKWYGSALGVTGRWQFVSSMATGLGIGSAVMYFQLYPTLAVEWFAVGLYGLLLGLSASGVYEVGKEVTEKAAKKALDEQKQL